MHKTHSHRNCRLTTSYWIFMLERSKLCKNLHGSGVYTSPYEIGTVPVKKLTCFFQVPNLHTLALKNSSRKMEPCKFLSVQKFVRTRVNGALVSTQGKSASAILNFNDNNSSIMYLQATKPLELVLSVLLYKQSASTVHSRPESKP